MQRNKNHICNHIVQQQISTSYPTHLIKQIQSRKRQTLIGITNVHDLEDQKVKKICEKTEVLKVKQLQKNQKSKSWSQIDLLSTTHLFQEVQNQINTHKHINKMYSNHRSINKDKSASQPHLSYNDYDNYSINSMDTHKYIIKKNNNEFNSDIDKSKLSLEELQSNIFSKICYNCTDQVVCESEPNVKVSSFVTKLSLTNKTREFEEPINQLKEKCVNLCKNTKSDTCPDLYRNNTIRDGEKFQEYEQISNETKESFLRRESLNISKSNKSINYELVNKQSKEGYSIDKSGYGSDKAGQLSLNQGMGQCSPICRTGPKFEVEELNQVQGQDAEWINIVESELRNILEPNNFPAKTHLNLSDSISSITPPLPPLTPFKDSSIQQSRFSTCLSYETQSNYKEYGKEKEKNNNQLTLNGRDTISYQKDILSKHYDGLETGDLTSTTTGLDLDSMLERSDSDLSIHDACTIKKQLEGLEHLYSEVLKLLINNVEERKISRGLTSYESMSSLPTSSLSSRPLARRNDKRKSHSYDDKLKKLQDNQNINKRFQRLESHVVTLARSVAHLSSEMRTQHLMIQEMENIRSEMTALRTQTNMAMIRSQSQPIIKNSDLPALSNPSRVVKLTKFFGVEPPLIRLFLRKLGYEKYAYAFEKEKVGMVELPYLTEERLQEMGVPLGPRLRILQEARISVSKNPVYVI